MNRRTARRPAFLAIVIAMLVVVAGAAVAHDYEPPLPDFPDPRFVDPQVKVQQAGIPAIYQAVALSRIEAIRAQGNAQLDARLVGCPAP